MAAYRINRQMEHLGAHIHGWRMVLGLTAQQVSNAPASLGILCGGSSPEVPVSASAMSPRCCEPSAFSIT